MRETRISFLHCFPRQLIALLRFLLGAQQVLSFTAQDLSIEIDWSTYEFAKIMAPSLINPNPSHPETDVDDRESTPSHRALIGKVPNHVSDLSEVTVSLQVVFLKA